MLTAAILPGNAQSPGDRISSVVSFRYIDKVDKQATRLESGLGRKTVKVLESFRRQENKIIRKLSMTDSSRAKKMAQEAREHYALIEQGLLQKTVTIKKCIPSLDSLTSSVAFLKDNPEFLNNARHAKEKLVPTLEKLSALQGQFQKAEDVKKFIDQRKQYLKEQLQNPRFARQLKKLNKELYYYAAQVSEYKSLLHDKAKATKKGLELLGKTSFFQDFMRKHSQLAKLFSIPGPDNPAVANIQGLQTRAQVTSLIQAQLGNAGSAAQAQFTRNLQDAQTQLDQLKQKILKIPVAVGNSDDVMPEGFKPNHQKTKSFLKRIELGTNIQSQRGNSLLPVTSDIGLSAGYNLNDKSLIGIGASYKLGWGESLRNIKLTNQGMGLRSFIDYKIKGSFWMTGGYEWNYRPALVAISESWQQSGLIGLSKRISLNTKILKQTKVQLLWDMLSYRQVPRTPAIVFRVGYGFR